MARIVIVALLLSVLLAACGGGSSQGARPTAFTAWNIPADTVPAYSVRQVVADRPDWLHVQLGTNGVTTETGAKQVMADYLEKHKAGHGIVWIELIDAIRPGGATAIYITSKDQAWTAINTFRLDEEKLMASGFPALIYQNHLND